MLRPAVTRTGWSRRSAADRACETVPAESSQEGDVGHALGDARGGTEAGATAFALDAGLVVERRHPVLGKKKAYVGVVLHGRNLDSVVAGGSPG